FDSSSDDLDLLMNMARLAAAANLPFIGSAGSSLVGLADFTQLPHTSDLDFSYTNADNVRWVTFRGTSAAQYVALTLPRMLLRLPYSQEPPWRSAYVYEERVNGGPGSPYLWGSSAYALAARTARGEAQYGWGAGIQGSKCGGLVENLPLIFS